MRQQYSVIARRSILLRSLPDEVVDDLMRTASVRHHERGATLFLQGEPATGIFIVIDGWVKLYRIAPSGAEAVVSVFAPGDSFGEAVALAKAGYPVAAEAASDCTVLRIDIEAIQRLLRARPELALSILASTFAHFHSLVAQIEALKAQTGAQRVAEFLLELARCDAGACEVNLPYDKILIAGRLGMKPESLSRAFAKLRDHGVTIRQATATIQDIDALRLFAEEDPALAWNQG